MSALYQFQIYLSVNKDLWSQKANTITNWMSALTINQWILKNFSIYEAFSQCQHYLFGETLMFPTWKNQISQIFIVL
jgi:hypothetical protein